MAGLQVRASGPLFDGRAARAIASAVDEAREDIAEFAEEQVLSELGRVLRHPTGYYESRITTDRVSADTSRVGDQGVVYGPWLEGVGSRNSPVTCFPGYGHWRRTKDLVKDRAPFIAQRAIAQHLPEMG
ncbi:hypothetical protein [Streptomyces tremellae]|uniref:HK97 gp10 family phage protein n=1 Tax=Streptomyces tremellae TaxID=1124239 RepID=A0ABP7EHL3_9ACTN